MDDILEFIFDVLFEAIFELFFEVFIWIASIFAPSYVVSPLVTNIIKAIIFILSIAMLLMLVWGIIITVAFDGEILKGKIYIGIGAGYFGLAIVLRIARRIINGK